MALVIPISQKMASAMFSNAEPDHGSDQSVVDNVSRAKNLPNQFLVRLDMKNIVDKSDQEEKRAGSQNHPGISCVRNKKLDADENR